MDITRHTHYTDGLAVLVLERMRAAPRFPIPFTRSSFLTGELEGLRTAWEELTGTEATKANLQVHAARWQMTERARLRQSVPDERRLRPGEAVQFVFDGPPGPESGRFVEAEDDFGNGFRIGRWVDRGDGTWALRVAGSL